MGSQTTCLKIIENELSRRLETKTEMTESLKGEIKVLLTKLKTKLQENHRIEKRFLKNNDDWLKTTLTITVPINGDGDNQPQTDRVKGRPSSDFQECCVRTKRRKTAEIRKQHSFEELGFATQMSLRAEGKLDAAKVVQDVVLGTPSKASKYRSFLEHKPVNQHSCDAALALIIDNNLSKNQYVGIRSASIANNCRLYPPYYLVLNAKKKCYPEESDISVSECHAEVKLQSLLNHTVERILSIVDVNVIKSLSSIEVNSFHLICKWGCDGTSGQSKFKQSFKDNDDGQKSDESIFFTSLVPIQIISIDSSENGTIMWQNPRPASPRFCRPIKIEFVRETVEVTKKVVSNIENQIKGLSPYEKTIEGKQIKIFFKLALTMVDGKVCNSLTDTSSSQRCYLCLCTSKNFNDIDHVLKKEIVAKHLHFGISSLHAWIRFFECLLHLSYKLGLKKWQARGEDKKSVESKKKFIQKEFRSKLGLIVDEPKPGYGSTNDGNTARRFFQNSEISASITGLDEEIIKRFHTILQVLSCGQKINVEKFEKYALDTARTFVALFPWYHMPTTVHKILIHGGKIIENSLLPIGQMSEEAQESCNKSIKKFRRDFSRKNSREKTMTDVFFRLLVASDPLISNFFNKPVKTGKALSLEAIEMLEFTTQQENTEQEMNEKDDSSDSETDSDY